jgi:Holliday junction DNA helicase RuvA
MVLKCSSSAPHKLPSRVLLLGLNWWRNIKLLARRDELHLWLDAVVLEPWGWLACLCPSLTAGMTKHNPRSKDRCQPKSIRVDNCCCALHIKPHMIGKLSGTLIEKNPPQVMVDCHGVGYEVDVPMSTFYNLPAVGESLSLLTHFVVREDAQILYGFATAEERTAFRQLIKISGVGPRMALGVLSGLSVTELAQAISLQEAGRLVKIPGVGKKTAERLLLELKGKMGSDLGATAMPQTHSSQNDILQALMSLGYSDKEATAALKQLPADIGVSDGIKQALKALAR